MVSQRQGQRRRIRMVVQDTHPLVIPRGDIGTNFVVREYRNLAVEGEVSSPQGCPATCLFPSVTWSALAMVNNRNPL